MDAYFGKAPHTLLNTRAVMPEGNGGRILVAEDEPLVLNVVSNVLVRFGYEVVGAGDGSSAYELFQQHACELVLLVVDIAMPKKSGVELVQHLPTLTPRVPVLFI